MEVVTKGRCEYYVSVGGGVDGKNKNPWPWWTTQIIYLGVIWDGLLSIDVVAGGMRPKLTVVLVGVMAEGGSEYHTSVGGGIDVNKIPWPWPRGENWPLAPQ